MTAAAIASVVYIILAIAVAIVLVAFAIRAWRHMSAHKTTQDARATRPADSTHLGG
ncbi:MAG: hypothetical protein Q4B12_05715 [Bowdeniella nasicola]|nr:hypothetical protein [Bowdeniella nasicola]